MIMTLTVKGADFTEGEVWATVNYALQNGAVLARLRRDHFHSLCLEFERKHGLTSEEFLEKFERGEQGDQADYFDWYAAKRGADLWARRHDILVQVEV